MGSIAIRVLKELAFVVITGLLGDVVKDALKETWHELVQDRPAQVAQQAEERTDVAGNVVPPKPPQEPVIEVTDLPVPPPPPPPPPEPRPRHLPDSTVIYPHTCKIQGKGDVVFDVVVFSDSYNWVYESIDKIDGLGGEKEFREILSRPYYRDVMGKAREIIVAGTASCEGTEWSLVEDGRALDRAKNLKKWLEGERSSPEARISAKSLHTLNLGRYWDDCQRGISCNPYQSSETSNQRKIILMAVMNDVPDLAPEDFESCIAGSMSADSQLDLLTRHYCRHDVNVGLNGEPL